VEQVDKRVLDAFMSFAIDSLKAFQKMRERERERERWKGRNKKLLDPAHKYIYKLFACLNDISFT